MFNTARIKELALATPDSRNRYVDFLRAFSILFVVFGHWLIIGASTVSGQFEPINVLEVAPYSHVLTWLFQVMPIFFIVGGYSNATSLNKALSQGTPYAQWLQGRLQRLLTPLLGITLLWVVVSLALNLYGLSAQQVAYASKAALIPSWFLAIYLLIVLLAPVSYQIWLKWGWWSFSGLVILALACDALYLFADMKWVGWLNYLWVWLAVHHIGFAWYSNRLPSIAVLVIIALLAITALHWMVWHGPYPIAMAGSPGEGVSNSLPPKVTLLLLGILQFSILYSLQTPMNRLLKNVRVWSATIFINAMIMSVYLWHMTVLIAVFGIIAVFGLPALEVEPASAQWWTHRPAWMIGLLCILLPVVSLVSGLERMSHKTNSPSNWRLLLASTLACAGIALMALNGFTGELTNLWAWTPALLLFSATWLSGVIRFRHN